MPVRHGRDPTKSFLTAPAMPTSGVGANRPRGFDGEHTMNTQVILVTGALTGIGRAAARAFAQEGHRVVVSGRHHDAGEALARELRSLGAEAEFITAGVRRDDDV